MTEAAETEIGATEEVVLEGVTCRAVTVKEELVSILSGTDRHVRKLIIPLEGLPVLTRVLETRPWWQSDFQYYSVVDADGAEVASGWSLLAVGYDVERRQRDIRRGTKRQQYQQSLTDFHRRVDELRNAGYPVSAVQKLLDDFRKKADRLEWDSWELDDQYAKLEELARAIESAIKRLQASGPLDALVSALLAGTSDHSCMYHNRKVLAHLESYRIRSGGYIEVPSQEQLEAFYRQELDGCSTRREMQDKSLRLDFYHYAPFDVLQEIEADPELGMAPETLSIQGRKEAADYPVIYQYMEIDGEQRPVGIVQLPASVYQRVAVKAHGQESSLPTLPHGITLILEVIKPSQKPGQADTLLGRGENDETLYRRISKRLKGMASGRNVSSTDEFGLPRRGVLEPTPLPPWFVGKRPRG